LQRISNQHRDAFEKKSAQRVNELELQLHFAERARRRLLRNYNICNSLILMYIPCAAPVQKAIQKNANWRRVSGRVNG
jgi:hypothetical protein